MPGPEDRINMKIFRYWKYVYALCCLAYIGWMIHVGTNEFDRVNGQYRLLVDQLDPGRVRIVALEELAAECIRKKSNRPMDPANDSCSTWPPQIVTARVRVIEERFNRARERGFIKLAMFYTGFVTMFLLGPPILVYLLIVAIILLYKNIKFVR